MNKLAKIILDPNEVCENETDEVQETEVQEKNIGGEKEKEMLIISKMKWLTTQICIWRIIHKDKHTNLICSHTQNILIGFQTS